MPDHEILEYRPEFQEATVALYSEAFGLTLNEGRRYLDWKYQRNPYLSDPLIVVARSQGGAVVGMRGFYGTCWEVGGERVVLPCADDFAITDRERDKGLMTRIMRTALECLMRRGYPVVLNASGGRMTVLQSVAMGWTSLGAMQPVARLSWPERARRKIDRAVAGRRFLWRLSRQVDGRQRDPLACLDERGQSGAGHGRVVLESLPRPEAMAQLAGGLHGDGRARHVRDPDFYRWRYGNPTREYRFLILQREGIMEGYLAIAKCRRSRLPIYIVDIEATTDEASGVLLESALTWGRFPAVGAWSASFPPRVRLHLTRLGFVPTDSDLRSRGMPCVLYKMLGNDADLLRALTTAEWDIRLIDSMHG